MHRYRTQTALVTWLSGLLALGGCVTTINRDEAQRLGTPALCMQYGHWLRKANASALSNVAAELKSRGATPPTEEEHSLIRAETVAVGMSECGVLAAMGSPNAQNNTVTASGRRTQYVFQTFAGRRGAYVYTENGIVTAIQN